MPAGAPPPGGSPPGGSKPQGGGAPPPDGVEPDPDEKLLTAVATKIVRMGLAVPAVFFLESSKPLSFVGSQALVFFEPFVKAFLNVASYDRFTALMEDRKNVERLIRRVEELEEERARAEREEKARKRAEKGEKGRRWFRKGKG
ncbi:MAG: hypothetical protein ACE15D_12180 [Candidatus Eisenbacteria bacterium]